jgi:transglutaminase-like putative cysteine protease
MIAALQKRLYAFVLGIIPTLLLTGGMIAMLSYSVDAAQWVKDNHPISNLLVWGLIIGWLLAASRWSGWVTLLFSMFIGAVGVVQELAQVSPNWIAYFRTPYGALVDGMHLRLVTFLLRASGWLGTLNEGGSIRDTGFFVLVIAFTGWCATIWLMWWMVRRKQAFPGVLPLFILMAINVHLSRQPRNTLLIFAVFAIGAMVRSAFAGIHQDWRRRQVDYSEDLAGDWSMSGSLVVVSVIAFAWLFSVLGTPDGWKLLSDMVEKNRQQMSDTANQLFAGVKPPPTPAPGEKAIPPPPSVNTPNLGEIGSPIAQGDQVIFWVSLSDPPPIPDNVSGPPRGVVEVTRHYWRNSIFGFYTGRGWNPLGLDPQAAQPLTDAQNFSGRYLLKQHFEIEARHDLSLFSVNDPIDVSSAVALRQVLPDSSRLVEGRTSVYDVTSLATDVTILQMETAPTDYSDEIRAQYLQLPATVPARVKSLAKEVAGTGANPYQKAIKIQQYLRENYKYLLAVPSPPAGRDVTDYFLFDAPGGFCTYYATAMAVMLRADGVPARVAAGYAMGSYDPGKGMYRIPASASHAWVEVYFSGYGWVEFEPTPAYSAFLYPAGTSPTGGTQAGLNPDFKLPPAKKTNQLLWLLVPVGLVVLLWGMYFWMKAERTRLSEPGILALKLYRRVRRGLALAGVPVSPALTAAEYASEVVPNLEEYPRLSEVLKQSTRLFEQAAYSPRLPNVEDVTEGEWMWGQARGELFSLLVRFRFRR